METHLKIEYLAPYLPYNLKIIGHGKNISVLKYKTEASDLGGISLNGVLEDWHVKPILRPLNELKNEMNKFDKMVLYGGYNKGDFRFGGIESCSPDDYQLLLKNHFDVFGLIEKGLAIDINTLP